ncbi:MAG TPA: 50S ribosomal protein L17 [Spirochaetota bacterium]|nr:50S ribosomal protein L17 [Spirochaetota bacterium]
MKHGNKTKRLRSGSKHNKAMLRNLAVSLISKERIKTTVARAKLLRSFFDKLITKAKKDTLHNRRLVYRDIKDTLLIKKLFEDLGKRFATRNGGYTTMVRLGVRKGDGAEICYLKLVPELLTAESSDAASPPEKKADSAEDKKQPVEAKEKDTKKKEKKEKE